MEIVPTAATDVFVQTTTRGVVAQVAAVRSVLNEFCNRKAGAVALSKTAWSVGPNGQRLWSRLASCQQDVKLWKETPLAPANQATLRARRPPVPWAPIPVDLLTVEPEAPFTLDLDLFLKNLKCARRGAAGGSSGMTSEHLRPVLISRSDSEKFWRMGQELARAQVPCEILQAIRTGRLTALQKESGGVRGIVAGDIVRRLVARTITQQMERAFEIATAPFQYALSTRAGSECIAHVLQTLTDTDPNATVLSIDGIGAFDLVSREAMLRGLLSVEGGDTVLPFVRQFYGTPVHVLVAG